MNPSSNVELIKSTKKNKKIILKTCDIDWNILLQCKPVVSEFYFPTIYSSFKKFVEHKIYNQQGQLDLKTNKITILIL